MRSSVYWIRHPDHTDMFTQGYVGVSKDVSSRFEQHRKRSQNPHLTNSINKYGWDKLIKQVLLFGSNQYCLDIEKKLRSIKNTGWNLTIGGGQPPIIFDSDTQFKLGLIPWNKGLKMENPPWNKGLKMDNPSWNKGIPMTAETKEKVSVAKKGQKLSKEHYARLSVMFSGAGNHNFGKPMSSEQRAKISASKKGCVSPRKGVTLSPETCAKISASKMGTKPTQEQREKISKANLGRKHSIIACPHCQKSGGSTAMPRWHFDNCKLKDNLL